MQQEIPYLMPCLPEYSAADSIKLFQYIKKEFELALIARLSENKALDKDDDDVKEADVQVQNIDKSTTSSVVKTLGFDRLDLT